MGCPRLFPALLLLACAVPAWAAPVPDPRAHAAVAIVLAEHAPDVRLLSATLDGARLTLDLGGDFRALGPGSRAFEALSRRVHVAVADTLHDRLPAFEVETRLEGVPLPLWLQEVPERARAAAPVAPAFSPPAVQALTGRRIALSPGHGYYFNASFSRWVLQRSFFSGIVEDFLNHDFVTLVAASLADAGAEVRPLRELDRDAGNGESGFPRWQEAARYHVKALGADPSVWNEAGLDHLSQDIRCRPRYANAIDAELLVSIHNNGGGGTGTETLYDTHHVAAAESRRLADLLHGRVIAAIRRDYDPAWVDRRVQGFNGSYGENRLATRPAVIIEIAFMDRPTPDNAALRDERFKRIVAAAIAEGIREFVEGPVPAAPTALAGTGDFSAIALTWTDQATNETGFRVERRDASVSGWTNVATLPAGATSHRDATVTAGGSYTYRVQAFNAAGASAQFSNEATLSAIPAGASLLLASVVPAAAVTVRDWTQETVFSLTVTDSAGRAIGGATITGRDPLANAPIAGQADPAGRYTHRAVVPAGQAAGSYAFQFQAAKPGYVPSTPLTRTVTVSHAFATVAAPAISRQPASVTATVGGSATFQVAAETATPGAGALTFQWHFNGVPIPGATGANHTITAATAGNAGGYRVTVASVGGAAESLEAALVVTPAAWISNLSVRTAVEAGRSVIVGFVVRSGGKELLVRAAGPALGAFGVAGAAVDPRLEVFRAALRVAENNDWPAGLAPAFSALGAFAFPSLSRDAAVLQGFDGPGSAVVTGTAGGVVLVEGYDADPGGAGRLVNLSARNRAGTGADTLIAGFVIAGTGRQRVLVRAIGPALAAFGVTDPLADPRLEVRDATGRIAENDNWDAALAAAFAQAGAFALPAGSRDAALVLSLEAGRSYTAQVAGAGASTGEALVEIYELP